MNTLLLALCLAAPLAQAAAIVLFARVPTLRALVNVIFALIGALVAWRLIGLALDGEKASLYISSPLPNVAFAFAGDRLGLVIAALIASLAALNAIYAVGYARTMEIAAPARLLCFIALSVAAALGAALARNLFTFFVCYVAMVVVSCPPIAQSGARGAAQKYFLLLLSPALGLLLPAIVWAYTLAGGLDFKIGGILPANIDPLQANALLILFAAGLAAGALFPLHHWISDAMEAPIPASGLVHAVIVGSIGALGLLRVSVFVFGKAMEPAHDAAQILTGVALVGACAASLVALSKDDLKQRLAYATMAQIGFVTACAMIAAPAAAFAGVFQIVGHGVGKLSQFFTTGVVTATTGRTRASELMGLGRRMPWAFTAFALSSLSLAAVPPLAGAWSLLWLIAGAARTGQYWAAALAAAASLLTFAAFGPLAAKALFGPAPAHPFNRPDGASALVVAPAAIAGAATLALLFLVDPLARFLGPGLSP